MGATDDLESYRRLGPPGRGPTGSAARLERADRWAGRLMFFCLVLMGITVALLVVAAVVAGIAS